METITLEQIHEDLIGIKKEMQYIKTLIEQDYGLSDSLKSEIEKSRKRPSEELISNEEMRKEFG